MARELEVGGMVGGKYRLSRSIGTGAMGTVFETEDGLALKALFQKRGHKDAGERRARFLREAAVAARLDHPHVVPVLAHGIDEETDTPYYVMPLLSGEDLSAALERVRVLPPAVAVRITLQAARGLGAAHAAGVVHRDVKPSNLFLVDDGSGVLTVRVADFGLAKIPGGPDSLTSTGAFLGTPHYVSPEQATNAKSADARTDVWSLAMTLYHALTGAPAFARTSSFMALVLELTGNPVPSLQDAAPWVPPEIARVVHGALIRDPDLRCPSMGELELALQMGAGFDACAAPLRASEIAPAKDDAIAERAALPGSWEDLLRS